MQLVEFCAANELCIFIHSKLIKEITECQKNGNLKQLHMARSNLLFLMKKWSRFYLHQMKLIVFFLSIQKYTNDVETDRDEIQICIDDLSTESEDSIWTFHKICDVLVVTKSSIFIQHEKKNRETLYTGKKHTRTHLEGRLVELFGLDPAVASDYAENLIASMR